MTTGAPYDKSLRSLYSRLAYIYPSIEEEIEKIIDIPAPAEESYALSRLIKKFGSQTNCSAMVICFHYIVRNHQRLSQESRNNLKRLAEIENQSPGKLQLHVDTIQGLTNGHSDYATRIVSIYSATIVDLILSDQGETHSPDSLALGSCLEKSVTTLRLINPSFVERSEVDTAIGLLGHNTRINQGH